MDKTEKILKQLFKSAPLPELNADFTSSVVEETRLLYKPKVVAYKPLINPFVLWIVLMIPALIIITLIIGGKTVNIEFPNFLTKLEFIDSIKLFSNNYLIIAYSLLILLWFYIDFKLINYKNVKKL